MELALQKVWVDQVFETWLNMVYGLVSGGKDGGGAVSWVVEVVNLVFNSMEEEEVPLVDGVFEGALGALALEMEALVDAMVVYGG
ncbi:hypothetical protein Tco_1237514 [Tanacetum coccineum]